MTGFLTLLEREIARFFKVIVQTVITPFVSSFLYLLIFGVSLGDKVDLSRDVPYLAFLIPGLMMMGIMNNAFQNSSSSIVTSKFSGDIEDLRVVPVTESQILWAYGLGGLVRGAFVALVTMAVGQGFCLAQYGSLLPIAHPLALIYFVVVGGLIFGLLGISIAFWATSFEQLSAFSSFILLPLTYLGGVFISVDALSPLWRNISLCNPLLYLINGLRYGVLGQSDVGLGTAVTISLAGLVLFYFLARLSLRRGSFQRW